MSALPTAGRQREPLLAPACLLALVVGVTGSRVVAQDYALRDEPPYPSGPIAHVSFERHLATQPAPAEPVPGARPGLMERINGIARGRAQLEGGYAFLYDEEAGARMAQHAVPDLLVRFGWTDRLEIRLGWPGYVATDYDGPGIDGSSDDTLEPNVGLMLDLWPQQGIRPQTAVSAAVPITLEGNPFALDGLQPLAQLLYRWELTGRLALGGTTGLAPFDVDGDDFLQLQQTASLDWVGTRRLGLFAQWEMLVDHGSADDGSQHMLGAGFSYLLTQRLQLTWQAGLGLNEAAPDFLTDVRLAYRF